MATSLMRRNQTGANDIFSLQSRMWDWFTTPYGSTPLSKLFEETNTYVPPVDIWETPDEVVLVASLPGLNVDQIDIQVIEDKLTLAGEQNPVIKPSAETKMVQHLQGIRSYGKFSFSFVLPCVVNADQSQAKYENGMLYVRFHKSERERPVRIPVRITDSNMTGEQPRLGETNTEVKSSSVETAL